MARTTRERAKNPTTPPTAAAPSALRPLAFLDVASAVKFGLAVGFSVWRDGRGEALPLIDVLVRGAGGDA